MRRCIYCLCEKPAGEFNQEHAFPRALGCFDNHPTLNCVCQACNKLLGDELVAPFMRETVEGLMRYGTGHKEFTTNESSKHLSKRLNSHCFKIVFSLPPELIKMKWDFAGFNQPWHGFIKFPAQIGLWPATIGIPTFFTDSDLHSGQDLSSFVCDDANPALVYAKDIRCKNLIIDAVTKLGFKLQSMRDVNLSNLEGKMTFELNKYGARFVAYVAMNLLAYEFGTDFVLAVDFNTIRKFIRYGVGNARSFVFGDKYPILWNESRGSERIKAHQVVFDWSRETKDIIAKLSFYGTMAHRVLLSRDYSGIFRADLSRGLAFYWLTHKIAKIQPSNLILPSS